MFKMLENVMSIVKRYFIKKEEAEKEVSVKLEILDWNEAYKSDLLRNKAIPIIEKAYQKNKLKGKKVDKEKKIKSKYGLRSPLFATDYEDEDSFMDRYSCSCKELQGKVYQGERCPLCGTVVEFIDVDLEMTGWISLNYQEIIHPVYYNLLTKAIGENALTEIIDYSKDILLNGHVVNVKGTNPFKGYGVVDFKNNFEEILAYYRKKNKSKPDKVEVIDYILKHKKSVFTSHVPVFSAVLRPTSIKGETYFFNLIEKKYTLIQSLTASINSGTRNSIKINKELYKVDASMLEQYMLSKLQKTLMTLWGLIYDKIDKKDGHIKGQILGGRINLSARNVIIPDPSLKADEVKLCYLTFLELYKYEIIAHISIIHNITVNEAFDQWYAATINFNKKIYEIMQHMVKKRKPRVLINRNPTINYGSILCMTVVEVKMDYTDDYTLSLPIAILKVLNADFDGDILNIVSLKTKEMVKDFDKTFNPRKSMFISRNDGLFNNDFNLLKDEAIGLYEFNNI